MSKLQGLRNKQIVWLTHILSISIVKSRICRFHLRDWNVIAFVLQCYRWLAKSCVFPPLRWISQDPTTRWIFSRWLPDLILGMNCKHVYLSDRNSVWCLILAEEEEEDASPICAFGNRTQGLTSCAHKTGNDSKEDLGAGSLIVSYTGSIISWKFTMHLYSKFQNYGRTCLWHHWWCRPPEAVFWMELRGCLAVTWGRRLFDCPVYRQLFPLTGWFRCAATPLHSDTCFLLSVSGLSYRIQPKWCLIQHLYHIRT